MVRVQRPLSGDVTFAYGAPGAAENAASRITRVVDEAGAETRGYGKLGEVVRTTRTVVPLQPGGEARTYETLFTFDSFGRMLRIVYPDGETLRYGYDGGGLVTSALGVRPPQPHGTAGVEARPGVIDQFIASFAYSDIHNMLRNTQVHQIVEGSGQGEFPPHSSHDFDYQYTGRAPHQAVRIGELGIPQP